MGELLSQSSQPCELGDVCGRCECERGWSAAGFCRLPGTAGQWGMRWALLSPLSLAQQHAGGFTCRHPLPDCTSFLFLPQTSEGGTRPQEVGADPRKENGEEKG